MKIKKILKKVFLCNDAKKKSKEYFYKFEKYSFVDCKCETWEQFNASIIRLYHTIEKGLSFQNYRAGFGKENIEKLIISLEQYNKKGYDCSSFCYETALSCLHEYIQKNRKYGFIDTDLESRVNRLQGKANSCGGTIEVTAPSNLAVMTYEQVVKTRHSIRHFSNRPVDINLLKNAIELAQYTPSACNRQGWRTRIVINKEKMDIIKANQNGNKGFSQEFDKILVITADLRAQQRSREIFQAFIDGGMYAESVLNALFYYGIGSVPLSAALTSVQDQTIRDALGIDDSEVFILFVGIGNYPDEPFLTTRSERSTANIQII